jgi:hypothetical protein
VQHFAGRARAGTRSFADLVEDLVREFEGWLSPRAIVDVTQCCERSGGSPVGVLPEVTQRLARERPACLAEAAAD